MVTLPFKVVVWAVVLPDTPVIAKPPKAVVAPTVLPNVTSPLPFVIVRVSLPSVPFTAELKVTAALVFVVLAYKVLSVVLAAKVTAPV